MPVLWCWTRRTGQRCIRLGRLAFSFWRTCWVSGPRPAVAARCSGLWVVRGGGGRSARWAAEAWWPPAVSVRTSTATLPCSWRPAARPGAARVPRRARQRGRRRCSIRRCTGAAARPPAPATTGAVIDYPEQRVAPEGPPDPRRVLFLRVRGKHGRVPDREPAARPAPVPRPSPILDPAQRSGRQRAWPAQHRHRWPTVRSTGTPSGPRPPTRTLPAGPAAPRRQPQRPTRGKRAGEVEHDLARVVHRQRPSPPPQPAATATWPCRCVGRSRSKREVARVCNSRRTQGDGSE